MTAEASDRATVLAHIVGDNGVEVVVRDESSPYGYANLFRVRVRVIARVPECGAVHERTLERLGIRTEDVGRARQDLVDRVHRNTLPYLLRPDFPRRFSAHQHKSTGSVVRFPGPS